MSTPPWVTTSQNQTSVDYSQESYDLSTTLDDADEAKKEHAKASIIGGAAIAGTGLGLAIAGPIIGLLGGVTAATLATQNSKAGDAARFSGDVVLSVGDQMKDIDEKHKIVEKTKWGFGTILGKAKEIDQNHGVVEKTKSGISYAANKAKEVEADHGYLNSVANKLGRQPSCNYTPWPDRDADGQQKIQDHSEEPSSNVGLGKHFNFGIPNPFRNKPDCNYTPWPEK
mmetsp:Transcript_23198/g.34537  ORF Transcript_23198/g.34537 Transcript_23198/m.34537 type:complete len:227 (-) Transcript_23198:195-875(-)|eukprot:CAMPEP_0203665704 /NCGR_PEP_ID=MMETSP0090-20130426/2874_1 /ASSEMBLY_ACC=CAM_ASM_001088 /TAXON_ID=426623 /ORGANISM="Chaetoceros affinis, Strain CCMP159" /LENGTH=226 /DNA_ID=CAMNT_0050529351 /DNA_START=105 /DNA_END=785 /DNA_ORIENTATION=-